MPTIALVSRMNDAQKVKVQAVCAGKAAFLDFSQDRDGLATRGQTAEIVWGRVKPEEFSHLPNLRWIHATWTGVENVIFPELAASQVILTNTRGQNANAMSEHIVGALFYLARDFARFHQATLARQWKPDPAPQMTRVQGTRALILGVGAIARALAPKLTGLGVTLRGVNSSGRPAHGITDMFTLESLRADLRKNLADVTWLISLIPATVHTHKCIHEPFLRALKPGAGVINLSRGKVLDDAALLACLADNHLCGAVLDVTDPEPPPENSPLFAHPKILLTGHQSPHPFDDGHVALDVFLHNLAAYLENDLDQFQNRVDFAKGY